MKDFRFSYKFKMACKEDVLKLCPNIKRKWVHKSCSCFFRLWSVLHKLCLDFVIQFWWWFICYITSFHGGLNHHGLSVCLLFWHCCALSRSHKFVLLSGIFFIFCLSVSFSLFMCHLVILPPQGGCGHLFEHHSEERHATGCERSASVSQMSETAEGGRAGDGEFTLLKLNHTLHIVQSPFTVLDCHLLHQGPKSFMKVFHSLLMLYSLLKLYAQTSHSLSPSFAVRGHSTGTWAARCL